MTSILSNFIFRCNVLAVAALSICASAAIAAEPFYVVSGCASTLTVYVQASAARRLPTKLVLDRGTFDTVRLESPDPFDVIIHYPVDVGVYDEYRLRRIRLRAMANAPLLQEIEVSFENTATLVFERGRWHSYDGANADLQLPLTIGEGAVTLRIPLIAGHTPPAPIPPRIR